MGMLLVALVFAGGCDSSVAPREPEIVGRWEVVSFRDSSGDLTAVLDQAFHVVRFEFEQAGRFTWFQDGVDDEDDDTIGGTYVLTASDETTGRVRITLENKGFAVQLDFALVVLAPNRIQLSTSADRFNQIIGSDFSGTLTFILAKASAAALP